MEGIGIVGCGYWGKNLIRVFEQLDSVRGCCHTGNPENERWIRENYPDTSVTTDYDQFLSDDDIGAIAIATPIDTHHDLAKRALEAGKHVFVEKPLTPRAETAEELVTLADQQGLTLFVGYIFVHHPVFDEIEAIHRETPIEYLKFSWNRTGGFEEDIVENLGSHDLAMAYHLFGSSAESMATTDRVHACGGRNIVSLNVDFGDRRRCRIDLDRLSTDKRKTTTFTTRTGEVYVWSGETLSRFDESDESFETVFESTREPLEKECSAFLDAVAGDYRPKTDGVFGLEVTRMLERVADGAGNGG